MQIKKRTGYLFVGNYFNVPLYVHWNFFLICLAILIITLNNIKEGLLLCFIYFMIFVIHEFGHSYAAKLQNKKLHYVEISVLGGVCYTSFPENRTDAYKFILAGFIGQTFIFLFGLLYQYNYGMNIITFFLLYINAFSLLLNLVPYKSEGVPTDGYILMKLIKQSIKKETYTYPK